MAEDPVARRPSPALSRKTRLILAALILSMLYVGALWLVPKSPFLMLMTEHFTPWLVPSSVYARNLDLQDNDLVRNTFWVLTRRRTLAAVPRATGLLQSTDDYVWLNAAEYLGACGQREAVPYLIKALRHTASHSDAENVGYLRNMTGQDFGTDFARWQQWWLAEHRDSTMDWTAHLGRAPRVPPPPRGARS
jgi:hypothetical protein